jgi:hypothetical protein
MKRFIILGTVLVIILGSLGGCCFWPGYEWGGGRGGPGGDEGRGRNEGHSGGGGQERGGGHDKGGGHEERR